MSDDAAAIEEIKQLKARYFRYVDAQQWDGWYDVFAADATLDTVENSTGEHSVLEGRQTIIDFVSATLEGATTCHHGHMPEIELLSPTTAKGVWAMEDYIWAPEGHRLGFRSLHGYGHYHETYEKIDGRWRINTSKLTRIRVDIEWPDTVHPRDGRAMEPTRASAG